jgi:hypothetical protein
MEYAISAASFIIIRFHIKLVLLVMHLYSPGIHTQSKHKTCKQSTFQ